MEAEAKRYTYTYHLGKFDKEGKWTESAFSDQEVIEKLESSLRDFHTRLHAYIETLNMKLEAVAAFKEQPCSLTA